MAFEIERKFLVKGNFKKYVQSSSLIKQGYLCRLPERTVRIRIRDNKGYITIKGKSSNNGLTRYEFEKEIPCSDANDLLNLCEEYIIEKTRYIVTHSGHDFEIDVFHKDNNGLITAEIELNSEDEIFSVPEWLGEEVTGKKEYYNSYLSTKPYCKW